MGSRIDAEPTAPELPARAPRPDRPDPRPARLMVGAGALAAVAVIGAGLVDFPLAEADEPPSAPATPAVANVQDVKRPVKYIRLKPGQKAPKGARVIKEAAPTPRVVVRQVVTQVAARPARTVARSRQSGG